MRHPRSGGAVRLRVGMARVLALAACSGPEGGTGIVEGVPVAYVAASSDSRDDALLEGTLKVSDSCVVIVDEFGQTLLPIFQRPRTTWDGTTLTYNGKPYPDGLGIRPARLHDARHTAVTLLLVQGVDQRVVMSMFGWTSPAMTTRYQHVVPELVEEANRRMGESLWGAQSNNAQASPAR